jgi:predicted enzyme involved in methoxymalonyl-ACP biosynthesis
MTGVWSAIRQHSTAAIIQSNFVLPYERTFGNFDLKMPHSFYAVVAALNAEIASRARQQGPVLINDVDALASWIGRRSWFDDRLWDLSKYLCAVDHLPGVAQNIVDIVLALRGRVVKCVVLDLDNTLWGGVIGDSSSSCASCLNVASSWLCAARMKCRTRCFRSKNILKWC